MIATTERAKGSRIVFVASQRFVDWLAETNRGAIFSDLKAAYETYKVESPSSASSYASMSAEKLAALAARYARLADKVNRERASR